MGLVIYYGLTTNMIKKYLPKSLLVRAISIVILPMIVFQLIIVTVFFDSLWERVIARMSRSVAMEIALTVNQIKNNDISILRANRDYGSFTEMNIKKITNTALMFTITRLIEIFGIATLFLRIPQQITHQFLARGEDVCNPRHHC